MRRQVVSLSIPDELLDPAISHMIDRGYSTFSEYVRELIRIDLRQNSGLERPRVPSAALSRRRIKTRNSG